MIDMPDSSHTDALDKTCELAESSAAIYATLSEMSVDTRVASQLSACARAREQTANDLWLARQEGGELPARGHCNKGRLPWSAQNFDDLVDDPAALYHSLRELDLEVNDAAQEALRSEHDASVIEALQSLVLSLEEAAKSLDAAS